MEAVLFEKEVVAGIVRGLTGEVTKLFVHEANDVLNPWPELKKSFPLCKKPLPPPSVSVKSTTAVSPVVGKKILHLELDVEVDDAWEVKIQQASASTMAVAPPVMIKYAAAHLLVSAILAVLWNKFSESWKKSKEEKKKKKKESDGGSGTGAGAGPIPTD